MNDLTDISADLAIRARGLRKVYRLYRKPSYRALDIMGLLPPRPCYFNEHMALRDVDLDIRRGEKVAIIGRNGAGKSTLLRLITKVIEPSAGTLTINGNTQALLSLGTGFHPELTGRQNAMAYLANFGVAGRRAQQMLDEIIEFAELEEYIDQPMKTYSTGMGMRLMFAASTMFVPDLLVIDEVLGVGDAYFQAKSFERVRDICSGNGATLLLVTHDVFTASSLCERMIWIDNGSVLLDADSATVLKAYDASIRQQEEARLRKKAMLNLKRSIEEAQEELAILVIELRSPTNTPAAAPVHIARIALLDGDTTVAEAALTGGIEEAQATGKMVTGSGVWGEVTTWNGRLARTMNNFGSSLHKVAVSFLLPKDLAARVDDLTLQVECGANDAYTLEAMRIDPDLRTRSLGALPSNPQQWCTFSAPLSGAPVQEQREEEVAILRSVEQSGSGRITITGLSFVDETGGEKLQLTHGRPVKIRLGFHINDAHLKERCQIVLAFKRDGVHDSFRLFGNELEFDGESVPQGEIIIEMARLPLGVGEYTVTVLVAGENYYEEKPTVFYTINPKVYWARRSVVDIKVTSDHLVPVGTGVVGDAAWSMAPLDGQTPLNHGPAFKLDCSSLNANWAPGTAETQVRLGSDRLSIESDHSASAYQLVTDPIKVDPAVTYLLSYNVNVTSGAMGIGAIDGKSRQWLGSTPIQEPKGMLEIVPSSDQIVVILFNNNDHPRKANAEVAGIELHPGLSAESAEPSRRSAA